MSEPVAEVVSEDTAGLYDVLPIGTLLYHADEIERKDAAIAELFTALEHAEEMVREWGQYASNYFQKKWDLDGDITKLRATLAKYDNTKEEA